MGVSIPRALKKCTAKRFRSSISAFRKPGEQAAFDTGIHDLHPELVRTLGRLRYRTSYGQNVLNHSLEVAYLSGVMASELGLDPVPAKRADFFTISARPSITRLRAVMPSSAPISPVVSVNDLRSFTPSKPIMPTSIRTPCSMCSCRLPMRFPPHAPVRARETLDAYIKRLEKLEEIANSYEGVERTYAIQAVARFASWFSLKWSMRLVPLFLRTKSRIASRARCSTPDR